MRNSLISIILLISTSTFSGELFKNEDFGVQVMFPDIYESKELEDEEDVTISATCSYRGMLFILNAINFKKEFIDDERSEQEAVTVINVCQRLGAKFKLKKVTAWNIGDESGYICPIKGKRKSGDTKVSFYGNFYVIFIGQTQYQLTVLSQKRKGFDGGLEREFWKSFQLL